MKDPREVTAYGSGIPGRATMGIADGGGRWSMGRSNRWARFRQAKAVRSGSSLSRA